MWSGCSCSPSSTSPSAKARAIEDPLLKPRTPKAPARISPIRAGLRCRCPRCGKGKLFAGFLKVADACAVCGFDFTRLNTGDGAAVFVIQITGFIVVFGALFTQVTLNPPMWVLLAVWAPLTAVIGLALMRPLKGMMIGLQVRNRASEVRNDDF
ncbi:MAG TPA: DUF983 domain-containing protein [Brevundimonas sp.]